MDAFINAVGIYRYQRYRYTNSYYHILCYWYYCFGLYRNRFCNSYYFSCAYQCCYHNGEHTYILYTGYNYIPAHC